MFKDRSGRRWLRRQRKRPLKWRMEFGLESLESRLLLSIVPGYFNFDGKLTNADLPAMLLALQNPDSFRASHGLSTDNLLAIGDINKDGALTAADTRALATLLTGHVVAPATARLGDFNLDAQLTAADIPAMASALTDLGTFEFNSGISAAYVNAIGDINHDGAVTNADFQALLGLVSNSVSPLTAALTDDTGSSGSDGITSDPDISGTIANTNRVTSFRAGFDSAPVSSYSSVIAALQPNGGFAFNRATLEQILGGPLLDGSHTLHLLATDANGTSLGTKDVAFTLDTQAPVVPNFNLAPGFAVTTSATTFRSVTLVGSSDPGIMVSTTSSGTLATTTTGADGSFQLANVVLSVGSNSITLTATDLAGNISTATKSISRTTPTTANQVALDWNTQVLNAIQQYASTPEYASRALAIVSAAMYDAENSVSGVSNYVYVHISAPVGSSDIAAVAQAAHDALVYLYPAQQSVFDAQLATSLASVTDPTARTNGVNVGQQVAAAIIAMRANDGSTNYVDYTPGTGDGVWQPTYPAYMPAENPQWATLTPFIMTSDSQFRPAGPPALNSAQWVSDYNQVKSLGAVNSTTRTADQTQIALFWNDPTGTATPPGHWNLIANQLAASKNLTLADTTKMLAELNVAMGDAAIVAWDAKYTTNFWRPITAIPAGGGNSSLTADPNWRPLLTTPPFPEYISGHSTFSSAAAAVLDAVFGWDPLESTCRHASLSIL